MEERNASYRPHDPGHDYYAPGIYLITLVVRNRENNGLMFGHLNDDLRQPAVVNNDVGKAVLACWGEIPERQARHGRKVAVHTATCMPDHFHGVIEVLEKMDVSLGEVVCGFKIGCTQAWRKLLQPCTAAEVECAGVVGTAAEVECAGVVGTATGEECAGVVGTAAEEECAGVVGTATGEECAGVVGTAAGEECAGVVGTAAEVECAGVVCVDGEKPYMASCATGPDLHRMSKKQRAEYYALHPEVLQPLWDDNYDDTICLSNTETGEYCQRHFGAMVQYVDDNARRAIIRRLRPEFMQRCLHVHIATVDADGKAVVRDYAAFGNLFLLRWARKVQVFCHRLARRGMLTDEEWQKATASAESIRAIEAYARGHKLGRFDREWYRATNPNTITAIDYSRTAAYRRECEAWETQVLAGATAIVTPGISKGELMMKNECLEKGYPLIHLQKEPIGRYWKPEKGRFEACTQGRLLILAPWEPEELGEVGGVPSGTDYSVFHNLNRLAEEICLFDGEAVVLGGGR